MALSAQARGRRSAAKAPARVGAGAANGGWVGCWPAKGIRGHTTNSKELYLLYREEKLMVRPRGGRKRALRTRAPMELPHAINQR
jgi:hypothetical protein